MLPARAAVCGGEAYCCSLYPKVKVMSKDLAPGSLTKQISTSGQLGQLSSLTLPTSFLIFLVLDSERKMRSFLSVGVGLLLLIVGAQAQFQFFEQMFQGGGGGGGDGQHRQPQDGPSDSQWYQDRFGDGRSCFAYGNPVHG